MAKYWRRSYHRRDGTPVRGHWVHGPDGNGSTPTTPYSPPSPYAPPPVPNHAAPRHRKKKRKLVIAITATAAVTAGAVTFTVTRGGSADASESVSAQASIDLKQVLTYLPRLGFTGSVPQKGTSDSSQDCSQSSTKEVKQFLTENPCKEYAVTLIELHRQGIATQAVITWVVMPTSGLTVQYKKLADKRHAGNPPGQPPAFNGTCYASGQDGEATWVAQVQPTRDAAVDRQILQAVAPAELSSSYLKIHCID